MRVPTLCLLLLICTTLAQAQQAVDLTSKVNPFIGTGGHGHTFPGATRPFGAVQLSPDTRMADWDGSSGYHYSDSVIYGFSHTHLSGTGIPDYCDLLLMPFVGEAKWKKEEYRSSFSHQREKATPGYYEVVLNKHNIKAQLTTTLRTGLHQYTFPANTKQGSLLIDLAHRDEVLDSWIEWVSPTQIRGYRRSKSWATDQQFYFFIEFEKPISKAVSNEGNPSMGKRLTGKDLKLALELPLSGDGKMRVRVGVSAVSTDGAKAALSKESNHWNFEQVRTEAQKEWQGSLSKIEVQGGTADQQTIFYTALYHAMLQPNVFQDVDGNYRATDGKVYKATNRTHYTVFSLWDTYRAWHPLMTILEPGRTTDWVRTFLDQHDKGGMLPVWELAGNETFCMIGYHSVPVIWDAWQKDLRGFDGKKALAAMRAYAESNRFGLDQYKRQGFISNEHEHESTSKTLEYAYDDWCIAQMAKSLGEEAVYKQYIERAQNWKNVFDPATGHMRGKVGALWYSPFDPREINNFYTEGNAWQYSFAVPQDLKTLAQYHGGIPAFRKKLESLFAASSQTTGRNQADVTGLIGQYAQGNEPSHHMAYLFAAAGDPARTQEFVGKICNEHYLNAPDGLIGNEDCGQMSAWYLFSAMGFYPVTPGSGDYILGNPVFLKVTIYLPSGKRFSIQNSGNGNYVSSWNLNGKILSTTVSHKNIIAGGALTAVRSDKAPAAGITVDKALTSISDQNITPVPYFRNESRKFRGSTNVDLGAVEKGSFLFYRLVSERDTTAVFTPFTKTVVVDTSLTVEAYAVSPQGVRSKRIAQPFHRIPNDWTIDVKSTVHPMYTAGGSDALIDGLTGTTNWRSGEWQSYFDQDFEATINLQSPRELHNLQLSVLQDISPWIMFPKGIQVWGSKDGVSYESLSNLTLTTDVNTVGPVKKNIAVPVKGVWQYLRVLVLNGGKLPASHESAGQGSHMFIDEISIK